MGARVQFWMWKYVEMSQRGLAALMWTLVCLHYHVLSFPSSNTNLTSPPSLCHPPSHRDTTRIDKAPHYTAKPM